MAAALQWSASVAGYEVRKDHAVFQVDVTVGVGVFHVWKRFSEFKDLHATLVKALSFMKIPNLPSGGFGRNLGDDFLEKRKRKLDAWLGEVVSSDDARGTQELRDWLTQRPDDALTLPEQQTAVGLCLLMASEFEITVNAGSVYEHVMPLPSAVHLPGSSAAAEDQQAYAAAWQFSTDSYDIAFSVSALTSSSGASKTGGTSTSDAPRREFPIIKPTRCKSSTRNIQGSCMLPPPDTGSRSQSVAMASGATLSLPADSPLMPRHSASMSGGVGAASAGSRHSGSSSGVDFDAIAAAAAAATIRPEADEPITHVLLRFDNSYSKLRRKGVKLRCDVVPQEQAVAAGAAEEAYRTKLKDADDLRSRLRSGNLTTTSAAAGTPRSQEAAVLRAERDRYKAQLAEAHADLDAARAEVESLAASLQTAEHELDTARADLTASQAEAKEAKAAAVKSARAADMASERVRSAMHEAALAQGASTSKQHELEAAQVTIAQLKAELEEARTAGETREEKLLEERKRTAELQQQVDTHLQTIAALQDGSEAASLQEQLQAATAKATRTSAVLNKLAAKARSGEESVERLSKQKKVLAGEVLSLRTALEAARGEAAAAQGQAAGASRRADAAEAEAAKLQGALHTAHTKNKRLQDELAELQGKNHSGGALEAARAASPAPGGSTPVSASDLDALEADLQGGSTLPQATAHPAGGASHTPPQAPAPTQQGVVPPTLTASHSAPEPTTTGATAAALPSTAAAGKPLSQFRQGGGRGRGRGVRVLSGAGSAAPQAAARGNNSSSWLDNFTDAVSSVFVPDLPPSRSQRMAPAGATGGSTGTAARAFENQSVQKPTGSDQKA